MIKHVTIMTNMNKPFILPLEDNGLKVLPKIGKPFVDEAITTNTILEDVAILFPTSI